jgi:hypothetical protein
VEEHRASLEKDLSAGRLYDLATGPLP